MTSISLFSCCPIQEPDPQYVIPNPWAKHALDKLENGGLDLLKATLKPVLESYLDFQFIELLPTAQHALAYFSCCNFTTDNPASPESIIEANTHIRTLVEWRTGRDLLSFQQACCRVTGCEAPILEPSLDSFINWVARNLAQIQTVSTLDLKNRRISRLPREIGYFTALQTLNLENNKLTTLPDEMRFCSRLAQLNLSKNKFTALPEVVVELPNLISLEVCNNKLLGLTELIRKLSALQCLNISHNEITNLPAGISALTSLRRLDVTANPLRGALPQVPAGCIVEQTGPSLLEMLSQMLR